MKYPLEPALPEGLVGAINWLVVSPNIQDDGPFRIFSTDPRQQLAGNLDAGLTKLAGTEETEYFLRFIRLI